MTKKRLRAARVLGLAVLLVLVLLPLKVPQDLDTEVLIVEDPLLLHANQLTLLWYAFSLRYALFSAFTLFPLTKQAPNPSNVLGVFGLSIRTRETDLEDEFSRHGRVEKVTIVYDQRVCRLFPSVSSLSKHNQQSERSRGFGFIRMATVDDAARCVQELNGIVRHFLLFPLAFLKSQTGAQWPPHPCRLFCNRQAPRPYSRRVHGSSSGRLQGLLFWRRWRRRRS